MRAGVIIGWRYFAVSGLDPVAAALLGMLTAMGGDMARDLLLAEVPIVLRAGPYVIAALGGGCVVVLGERINVPSRITVLAGALLCFGLRMMAAAVDGICQLPVGALWSAKISAGKVMNALDDPTAAA